MQFLKVSESDTLKTVSKIVGDRNISPILATNGLKRRPDIGKQFTRMCNEAAASTLEVPTQRKITLLNTFTEDSDIFEQVSLFSEESWKVLSATGCMPGALRIPDIIQIPDSFNTLGGKGEPVQTLLYSKVMMSLQNTGSVDTNAFNEYSTINPTSLSSSISPIHFVDTFAGFNLPWGKISLYSSLAGTTMDFPVYPEELSDNAKANYITMPDIIYQYEPWYVYESSGPRTIEYTFHFHRDMWTGDHRDGMANKLIRFCQANCFPRYTGSTVNTSIVKMYINGQCHCSGIMTEVSPKWSGPIGLDGWYLDCELSLAITEVSTIPLNFDSVQKLGLIGVK